MKRRRLREVMIVGGSRIANYLASRLLVLNIAFIASIRVRSSSFLS